LLNDVDGWGMVLKGKLSNFQTFKLSNFQTFKLSNFQTFKLSNFQTFKLSNFQTFILSNFYTFNLITFHPIDPKDQFYITLMAWKSFFVFVAWAVAGLPQKQKRLEQQQENAGSICPKVLFLIILGFR
jgi:hypothetical protein